MKTLNNTLRKLVVDGFSFISVLTLILAGNWVLVEINASIFMLVVFSVLMIPVLISTASYFFKGIHEVSDRLITSLNHRTSYVRV